VVTIASLFAGLDLLVAALPSLIAQGFDAVAIFLGIFGVIFLGLGFAAWRHKRWSYLATGILGSFFLGSDALDPSHTIAVTLQTPASATFIGIFLLVAALAVAIPYGFYGFYAARRPAAPPRLIRRASAWALIGVGIAVGGLIIRTLAGATQARLFSVAGTARDVTMPPGAFSVNNPNFYVPETLTVQVGREVIWFNGDTAAHTVTSTGSPPVPFDSANMNPGDVFKFTFREAGSYEYYCTYHPWMTGQVTVQSG
jgi:plastocyanin